MNPQTLLLDKPDDHILQVTLDRPNSANAINFAMMQDLYELWHELSLASDAIRCIILTGSGKHFCAGADIKERTSLDGNTWQQQHRMLEKAVMAMHDCPIPIIAAVNGSAFGGGLELVLLCDIALATRSAKFAQPEVKLGLTPGMLATQHLALSVGIHRAKQLIYTGDAFSAKQAFEWGLVNQVTTAKDLLPTAISLANQIAHNAPIAIQQCKKAVNHSIGQATKTHYEFEIEAYLTALSSEDREEGMLAYSEKRPAHFKGQ